MPDGSDRIPKDLFPTEDEISQLAYEMFVAQHPERSVTADYWRLAESELLQRAAVRALAAKPRRRRS